MANALVNRANTINRTLSLFRLSSSFLRSFSSASSTPNPSDPSEEPKKKTKKNNKKNLFDVLRTLPDWGIGSHFARSHWSNGYTYELTKINLYKSGRHGNAWGIAHKRGIKMGSTQKMSGVNKSHWCLKSLPNKPKPAKAKIEPTKTRPIKKAVETKSIEAEPQPA